MDGNRSTTRWIILCTKAIAWGLKPKEIVLGGSKIGGTQQLMRYWLVVSNIFCFPFHIWDNPSHWLSYFSRWSKPPTRIVFCWCWFSVKDSLVPISWIRVAGQGRAEGLSWWQLEIPKLNGAEKIIYKLLVSGLEPWNFMTFPFSWECHHHWRTPSFFRGGRYTTNQIIYWFSSHVWWHRRVHERRWMLFVAWWPQFPFTNVAFSCHVTLPLRQLTSCPCWWPEHYLPGLHLLKTHSPQGWDMSMAVLSHSLSLLGSLRFFRDKIKDNGNLYITTRIKILAGGLGTNQCHFDFRRGETSLMSVSRQSSKTNGSHQKIGKHMMNQQIWGVYFQTQIRKVMKQITRNPWKCHGFAILLKFPISS